MNKLLETLFILLLIAGIGFGIYLFFLKPETTSLRPTQSQQAKYTTEGFFMATLQTSSGTREPLKIHQGKTIIVNFWATWCPPCREEMPDLSKLHKQYQDQNVVVLGLAIDALTPVEAFVSEFPVSYPLYIAEEEGMALSNQLGNQKSVLPYTAILDVNGHVAYTFYGKVDQKMLLDALKKMKSIE